MSTTKMSFESSFYVTGGTLDRDAACYVARQADQDLYDGLGQGQFFYVLTSRQMGKSSLMVRTAARLREERLTFARFFLNTGAAPRGSASGCAGGQPLPDARGAVYRLRLI